MITVSIISPKVSLQAINRVIEQNDFGCIFHKYVGMGDCYNVDTENGAKAGSGGGMV